MKANVYRKIVAMLGAMSILISCNSNYAYAKSYYYTNDRGLHISRSEYNYITNYLDEDDLLAFTQEEFEYVYNNIEADGISYESSYVMTMYGSDDTIVDEINFSEAEYSDYVMNNSEIMLLSYQPEAVVRTEMKKITLKLISISSTMKKVSLVCEWLSIPQVKSYDVIGVRFLSDYDSASTITSENIYGYQNYNSSRIDYNYDSGNWKFGTKGIGLSTNIVDSVSSNLKIGITVNVKLSGNTVYVAGSYQHAIENVTLANSKNYSFAASGMGGVFLFNSNIGNKYENTPGLYITGSITG